jgi:hypothetical protein
MKVFPPSPAAAVLISATSSFTLWQLAAKAIINFRGWLDTIQNADWLGVSEAGFVTLQAWVVVGVSAEHSIPIFLFLGHVLVRPLLVQDLKSAPVSAVVRQSL